MNTYYDKYGRLHDKYVTDSAPYPCNNSFLYSGEASLLGINLDKSMIINCYYNECATLWGFNRNPGGDMFPLSSHDEIVGLFMLIESHAELTYDYLKYQKFQVCNLPDFKPTPWYKLNPFKVVRDFWRLSREENPRKATYKYPYIAPIVFRHMPQHTYFYARCAGRKTGIIHTLYFLASSIVTIYNGSNSSKVMLGFKINKLGDLGLTNTEKLLNKIYTSKVDLIEEIKQYFPEDHPIVQAVT